MSIKWWTLIGALCLAALALGCVEDDDPADDPDMGEAGAGGDGGAGGARDGLAIAGDYVDDNGTEHAISEATWVQTFQGTPSVFTVVSYDNEAAALIAQNDAANQFNPRLFSRFDWVFSGDDLFFCQSVFDADTAEAASAAERPDDSDPASGGCGGMFPWSQLLPGG